MNPIFHCLPALILTAIRNMRNSQPEDKEELTNEDIWVDDENTDYLYEDREVFNHFVDEVSGMYRADADIEIKQDFPAFIIEGHRNDMYTLMSDILLWARDTDYQSNTIDAFEISMDFEVGYISFFMKPDNHK